MRILVRIHAPNHLGRLLEDCRYRNDGECLLCAGSSDGPGVPIQKDQSVVKWVYEIEWMDGVTDNIVSNRFQHPGSTKSATVIDIEINEHGFDRRMDYVSIPLCNVRRIHVREVQ